MTDDMNVVDPNAPIEEEEVAATEGEEMAAPAEGETPAAEEVA